MLWLGSTPSHPQPYPGEGAPPLPSPPRGARASDSSPASISEQGAGSDTKGAAAPKPAAAAAKPAAPTSKGGAASTAAKPSNAGAGGTKIVVTPAKSGVLEALPAFKGALPPARLWTQSPATRTAAMVCHR